MRYRINALYIFRPIQYKLEQFNLEQFNFSSNTIDQDELELIPHYLKCVHSARCFVNGTQMSSLGYCYCAADY